MPELLQEAKNVLNRLHISPRKKMGQNFMVSEEVLSSIADALSLSPGETVLEIGPGLGFLTSYLLKKTDRLVAVEKDRVFVSYLSKNFESPSVEIIQADILEWDPAGRWPSDKPATVAANIPYNITSPIIEWIILHKKMFRQAVITMQWEVAERLMAKPGDKQWGSLSVFVQFYASVSLVRKVSRGSFWPSPNVDSAVVKLEFLAVPFVKVTSEERFFETVRRAFQKRRKTILNSLTDKAGGFYGKENVAEALKQAGIDPMRRPETLSCQEWANLLGFLDETTGGVI